MHGPIDGAEAVTDNAPKLLDLAVGKFGTLSQAEKKLFEAVANGKSADCSADSEEDNDPADADKWDDERVMKADRIAWLCTDPQASALVTYRGIVVEGARIDGKLDLEFVRIPFPLYFEKSAFPAGIDLHNAEICELYLGGTYTGPIRADGLKVERNVLLDNEFKAEGEVCLLGATIGGQLDCENGRFINPNREVFSADKLKVEGSIYLRNGFKAEGQVRLVGATIGGNLECDGGQFIDKREETIAFDAERVNVDGHVFLREHFNAEGQVRLLGATIGGQLDCENGQFINPEAPALFADRLKVGDVFLRNGFKAEGEVRLRGATIDGDLDCGNGQFINPEGYALAANGLKVERNVLLDNEFKAEGEVHLLGAKIGGQVDCSGGQFINKNKQGKALSADDMNVQGSVFLSSGFKAEGNVCLAGATIYGVLVWTRVESPEKVTLDLRSAKIGTLWDDQKSWPESGKLFLNGLVYDEIDDRAPTDVKTRIDWLRRQPTEHFRTQPYEQLAAVLRKGGHDADAKKILIAKAKDRTRLAQLTLPEKCWYHFFGKFIGYGYRPWRAFWIGLVVVALGWLLFGIGFGADVMTPTKEGAYVSDSGGENRRLSEDYPKFNPLVYSFDMFVPLVNLHQASYWLPNANQGTELLNIKGFRLLAGSLLRHYLWFHIIMGWILTTLLVVGLTGLIRS